MWGVMDDDKIQQYIAITGTSIEEATRILEACNGDVNMAVSMHLDDGSVPSNAISSRNVSTSSQSVNNDTYEERHGVRAPIPQTQGVLIEQDPMRRTFNRKRVIPKSVFDPFQDYSGNSSASAGAGPVEDKRRTLSELFKPPIDLMFQGDFTEARQAGQSSGQWLMVNLQDSTEFSCQVLNRDLWSNEMVKKIIKDHFIFWQIHRITDDGIRFRQLYHVDTFPAIVIIDSRTGEKMEHWSHMTVQEFITKVGEFNSLNKLDDDQIDKVSTAYDKSEDVQLEEAIKASLAVSQQQAIVISNSDSDNDCLLSPESSDINNNGSDMEIDSTTVTTSHVVRGRKRQYDGICEHSVSRRKNPRLDMIGDFSPTEITVPGKSELSDDFEKVEINEVNNKIKRSISNNRRSNKCIRTEDYKEHISYSPTSTTDMCQILMRLPDGRRLIRSFSAEAAIEELFDCLKQEGFALLEYEVTATFPHTVVSTLPSNTTFKNAGLCPRQTVYVQKTD